MYIKSKDNKNLKLLRSLGNKKYRSKFGLFVAEGNNLLKDFENIEIESLFIRESDYTKYSQNYAKLADITHIVDDVIFNTLSDTVNSNGICAIIRKPKPKKIDSNLVIILDNIRDPGNLGTIFRTAVAMGVQDFVLINCVDPYSPKVVRASMGGVFYANIVECNIADLFKIVSNYKLCALDMKGENIYDFEPPRNLALVVGSEAEGLSLEIKKYVYKYLSIPMKSALIESLNAAVACSIAVSTILNNKK
ncbi:MAG: TrmH family RNA methyltransferase [Christensenellales bacterium]|jgi:TrmH family RNA methyltransferase|nr:RNA methyltransferase [Clostridiales bacterium]